MRAPRHAKCGRRVARDARIRRVVSTFHLAVRNVRACSSVRARARNVVPVFCDERDRASHVPRTHSPLVSNRRKRDG
ncbi:hypothetical protein WS69_28645 [Burkholderia sp. BDU5]|nr:hypothetical protein WS69_28645 [Burkholderia sp. BDU5]